jgi:hypothetical protein
MSLLLRGERERLDEVQRSADFELLTSRAGMVVDRIGVVHAYTATPSADWSDSSNGRRPSSVRRSLDAGSGLATRDWERRDRAG